jgi:alkylation response protein AidB-like acyl-CoA dehydrogenase
LVWTLLMAGVVDGAATGEVVVGGIERTDPSGLVAHAGALDVLAVLDDDGVRTVEASTLEVVPVEVPLDPLTPVSRLVSPLPAGDLVVPASQVPDLRAQAAVLTSALLLGLADGAVELAVAYARERQQFGRPIGAFQALKHLMADMYVRTELARASVYAAGVTFDDPSVGSILRASAGAKLTAGEAAVANAKTCIQVHGGMGYTWEVDAHLYLKRAYALDAEGGSREHWADELSELLGSGV